jgi:Raf kinase inhibitor-like YbhB/YbcL family protein
MSFTLLVEGFSEGGAIPAKYTCAGSNYSPALTWSDLPHGTRSLALIMDDPDAPGGVWNHWLLWNIPPTMPGLEENEHLHQPVQSGTNDFGKIGYGGPCPPKGHGPHRYFFHLFALDVETIGLSARARRVELDRVMAPHILAQSEFMGRFERK